MSWVAILVGTIQLPRQYLEADEMNQRKSGGRIYTTQRATTRDASPDGDVAQIKTLAHGMVSARKLRSCEEEKRRSRVTGLRNPVGAPRVMDT